MKRATKKYYDRERFDKIFYHRWDNSYATLLKEFEYYLSDFPYDVHAINEYMRLCIKLNELEKIRPYMEEELCTKYTTEKDHLTFKHLQLKWYSYIHRFEDCYAIFNEIKNLPQTPIAGFHQVNLNFYLRFKLGLLKRHEYQTNTYLFQQIINYDIERAANHIQKHIKNMDNTDGIIINSTHLADFLEQIQNKLPNENHFNTLYFSNEYCFKSSNLSYTSGDYINLSEVITLDDTNQITTMYPSKNTDNIPITDITSPILEKDGKVKRKNQIEKFNERYMRK